MMFHRPAAYPEPSGSRFKNSEIRPSPYFAGLGFDRSFRLVPSLPNPPAYCRPPPIPKPTANRTPKVLPTVGCKSPFSGSQLRSPTRTRPWNLNSGQSPDSPTFRTPVPVQPRGPLPDPHPPRNEFPPHFSSDLPLSAIDGIAHVRCRKSGLSNTFFMYCRYLGFSSRAMFLQSTLFS